MKPSVRIIHYFIALLILSSCGSEKPAYLKNFDDINNRVWVDKDIYTIPLEDWRVNNGRLECTGSINNMKAVVLTQLLNGTGNLAISVQMGAYEMGEKEGTAGLRIGLQDQTENNIKSLVYYGKGIDIGVHTSGYLFINEEKEQLPNGFSLENFKLVVGAEELVDGYFLKAQVEDKKGNKAIIETEVKELKGGISMVNNFQRRGKSLGMPKFWFDDLSLAGAMLEKQKENSFGPILWSMYTLSKGTMKMTAQMPPIGADDEQNVELQLEKEGTWETVATEGILKDARIATFKLENFDDTKAHKYRLVYNEKRNNGKIEPYFYEGEIQADPKDKPLLIGGLTCQEWQGYPYQPLVNNLAKSNPDLLYFSGDQLYEGNGGYPIRREPGEKTIINYLGKWNMFGWAFGDLMRNRPTICLPDDHEVYQGNLWGEGGKKVTVEQWYDGNPDDRSGYVQPVDMLNVVVKTNAAHLPDPYDATPMDNDIMVYYSDLVYGNVSFGIVMDRAFKSGPEKVSWWEGRSDHLKEPIDSPSQLEKPGLKLLGDRQLEFLEHWVNDWEGAKMKCLLTQTVFASCATHHGPDKMYLHGDLDTGGWPKSARDKAVKLIRKAHAFHIVGDQHIPVLVQYGIDDYQDAGWVFVTPAISVGYERRFKADELGWAVKNRPEHGLPNTGNYLDAFHNKNYIYAISNPTEDTKDPNRYQKAQKRASGYGLITFDTEALTIDTDAIRFLADLDGKPEEARYPGWPKKFDNEENYGKKVAGWLPTLEIKGTESPLVKVIDDNGELVYAYRANSNTYAPRVFKLGAYTIEVSEPESGKSRKFEHINSMVHKDTKMLTCVL
ncbi:alkaline phosphatase D family protein [Flammeovirgaceae bacterium SG7u.111]|nr:alkaline phosphatase D family protein [Flammeovirgaceae bacterium SG7u.132]WPO37960.1 alkaline phosphatase D family protein [Flammeovirgaceae bacterium SG7u.111]